MRKTFTQKLFRWYSLYKRNLPWIGSNDPYKVWLSEVILQQTRVEQGLSYYQKFVKKYPDIQQLANAPHDEVMKMWEGLWGLFLSTCAFTFKEYRYKKQQINFIFLI